MYRATILWALLALCGCARGDAGGDGGLATEGDEPCADAGTCGDAGSAPAPRPSTPRFEDVSAQLAAFERGGGEGLGGLAWLDYDDDGDLDLYVPNGIGESSALFRNDGAGGFTNMAAQAGVATDTGHSCALAGDIDNDGYPDLVLCGEGNLALQEQSPLRMFHNQGDGTFEEITATAGVPGPATTYSAAFGDIDGDGFIDLYIAAPGHLPVLHPPARQDLDRLYRNNGDLTFTDITESAGVAGGLGSCAASFSHYDDDDLIDLFVAVCNEVNFDETPFHVYRNEGGGRFTDVAQAAGLDVLGYWMSVTLGDYDNDGDLDLFSTNFGPLGPRGLAPHALFRNRGDGTYVDVASESMADSGFAWGSSFADFDNDTYLDLFWIGSLPSSGAYGNYAGAGELFFGSPDGEFTRDNGAHGLDLRWEFSSGVAQADYDADGFIDLAILLAPHEREAPVELRGGKPVLLRNLGNDNGHVTVIARGAAPSNAMAIGARITLVLPTGVRQLREVYAGSSFASTESPWPSFGMGDARRGDLEVRWPSGRRERFTGAATAGTTVELREGDGEALAQDPPAAQDGS